MTPEEQAQDDAWVAYLEARGVPYHRLDDPDILTLVAGLLRSGDHRSDCSPDPGAPLSTA